MTVVNSICPIQESPRLDAAPVDRSRRYARILVILFLCTLPPVNPIVHGDGVGYYAYVRPAHRTQFRLHSRLSTRESQSEILLSEVSATLSNSTKNRASALNAIAFLIAQTHLDLFIVRRLHN